MVRIPMVAYNDLYHDISSTLVRTCSNKRNMLMAQAPRYISHVTTRKIVDILKDNHDLKVSLGMVSRLKPFFVFHPSDREKLECLCETCCNVRNMFDAIQQRTKKYSLKLHKSITSYFTSGVECRKERNGYTARNCINGSCDGCCGIIKPEPYQFPKDDVVTYYQFELLPTGKFDKDGRPKKKTSRVDYCSVPTSSLVQKLNNSASRYLLHRFDVINDKFVWPLIQAKCDENYEFIVHMDFSENLKEKP